jgi:hypothetical protein
VGIQRRQYSLSACLPWADEGAGGQREGQMY